MKKTTILIADDTSANLALLGPALEAESWRVIVAGNGEEAVQRARTMLPDLILLDVLMPVMNGFEACKRLKASAETRDIPVIFMTALAETSDKLDGFAAGAVDYVTKPLQMAEVLARVRTHLTLRETHLELATTLQDLRHTKGALEESRRLAGLSSLVVGMAHELNTPLGCGLTAISTQLDLTREWQQRLASGTALKRSELDAAILQLARSGETALRALERAARLMERFREVGTARPDVRSLSRFCVCELVESQIAAHREALRATGVAVENRVVPGTYLTSYPDALARIVESLLDNVRVHAMQERTRGTVYVSAARPSPGWLSLQVVDDGKGMPAAALARAFEPFFTTRLGQGMSGLGLTLAHSLSTSVLGGEIRLHSQSGKGTSVFLLLPDPAPGALPSTIPTTGECDERQ